MDESALINRRLAELQGSNQKLAKDIETCQQHIHQNEAEIVELTAVQQILDRLRGARRSGPKQSNPVPPARSEQQGEKSETVGEIIKAVLLENGQPMRACDIDRAARAQFDRPFHKKQIGKDCCRLFNDGKLLKDDFTKEYSLPPDMGSDQTLNGKSLPYQSPTTAKGRKAVPGGLN